VDVEPVLPCDKGGQQTDRSGARDERGLRLPEGALADRYDLLPGFGDNRRGLEQYAQQTQRAVNLHGVLGLDPPAF
jgi:hypothetical protein